LKGSIKEKSLSSLGFEILQELIQKENPQFVITTGDSPLLKNSPYSSNIFLTSINWFLSSIIWIKYRPVEPN